MASSKLPVKTLPELIAYAKERPGQLNYGSVGIGSSQHLGGAYFEQVAGVKLTHVPYRNIAMYAPDLIAGTVPLGFQWFPNVSAPLGSGGAKAIAVAGKNRLAALPNVPTTAEAGLPRYEAYGWFALLAPRGTPKPIVAKLNQELAAAIADPAVRERFHQQGAEPVAVSPEEAAKFLGRDAQVREIITKAGIAIRSSAFRHARLVRASTSCSRWRRRGWHRTRACPSFASLGAASRVYPTCADKPGHDASNPVVAVAAD